MALLQFKPAPMYILDEIDAALDLSHTQHIGARFRDGTSVIGCTAQRSTSSLYNGERDWEVERRASGDEPGHDMCGGIRLSGIVAVILAFL